MLFLTNDSSVIDNEHAGFICKTGTIKQRARNSNKGGMNEVKSTENWRKSLTVSFMHHKQMETLVIRATCGCETKDRLRATS